MDQKARINFLHSLRKQADFSLTDTFVEALSSTFNEIKANPISGIAHLLIEGTIFMQFGWIGTIVVLILDKVFNVNIKTICSAIKDLFVPFAEKHKDTPFDINSVSENMASQVLSKANISSLDITKPFDQIANENPAIKIGTQNNQIVKQAFLGGLFAKLTLKTVFGSLIKALFIGAGFNMAGEFIKKTISPTKETIIKYMGEPNTDASLTLSYKNDADQGDQGDNAFYLLTSNPFKKMMTNLVFRVYPNASPRINNIIKTNFDTAIGSVQQEFSKWNPGQNLDHTGIYIRVPQEIGNKKLNSLKDIADCILSMFQLNS